MENRFERREHATSVAARPAGRCLIQVCGGNPLLNELLCNHLVVSASGLCNRLHGVRDTPCSRRAPGRVPCLRLDFVDPADFELPRQWDELTRRMASASQHTLLAFYNLPEDAPADLTREALSRGVRGFFYRNDSTETLEKGVRALVAGETWFRREVLYQAATGARSASAAVAPVAGMTSRERQALACLAEGLTNQEIADRLCVSLHTVKTHLYRIYRKAGVKNRHQAALWAAELPVSPVSAPVRDRAAAERGPAASSG